VPNQPRPETSVGVPQPVGAPDQPAEALPGPTGTLVDAQQAEIAKAHQESLERMRAAAGVPAPGAASARDPFSRPYVLPSGGLWYPPGHKGTVYISPTRGETEEMLAGMGEGAAASATLRHIAEQVTDFNGIDVGDVLVLDWPALLLNLLAYAAGDDRIFLAPTCPKPRGCGKPSNQTRPLAEMECVELRLAGIDQSSTWPIPEPDDPDLALLEEITGGNVSGPVEAFVTADDAKEPFYTEPLQARRWSGPPLPGQGAVIGWRHLRMRDMEVAEEFAQRTGSESVKVGSKLNNVVLALQIASINGNPTKLLQAYSWVKNTHSPILADLRRQMERRSFGYNMRPRFKCPHCGHSFQAALPLDGSLFRSSGS
jgi:hypothetical protein